MNTADERILNKIKKCLALSQSPEPAEAAAAMRQAQKLMEMHGISQADLGRADVGECEVKSKVSVSKIKDWELALINMVARAFGCKLLWMSSSSYSTDVFGRYVLVGLKTQVQLAQYTCEVLQRKLIKARSVFVQDLPGFYDRGSKTVRADGFCHGWVAAISKTVHDFAVEPDAQKMIDEEVTRLKTGGEAKVQRRLGTQDSYRAGLEAAAGESIHRPVADREPTLRLTA